ncbi:uncharacterized protein [Apostichopus japonicus]|uniref:uncharacterized protein isoform X3 n=1 Tax=Stichopus japonicus TaxID=307972 RepID=UPI003AB2AE19
MLLERYGELVLLDATYRTTKYALPLFLMVVRTNVGYTPVATFICESETTAHIAEALSIIKEWNLQWKPQFFMIDYSETEYQALQDVFPEAHKYVCSFHREQAWIRWCREGKNQLTTDNQHHLLKMLRDIATAKEKEKCDKGIHILRSSKLYSSNIRVKTYTETRWLGICQRWCRAYALPGFNVSVTTNNGVEALNRTLKQFYLKLTTTNTVSSLAETLVLDFIPDQLMSYTRKNYAFSSQYKAYNPQVPAFLHDRPRAFVKHCMTKISAATHYKSKDVQKVGENIFQVKSENSLQNTWYEVFLGDSKSFPKCQCAAFMENFMPCKHLFAIFAHSDATWNSLSPLYKNSAYFNLDLSFLSKEVQFKSCLRDDQEVGTGSPVQQEDETDVSGEEASTCNRYIHSTQKCLREKLKVLQDLSFLSSDVDVMSNVISQLTLACAELEQTIPRENQLPLHQSGKKSALRPLPQRKKKMKKAKQSKMTHRTDPPPKKRVHFEATGSGDKSSDPPPKKRVHFEATGSGDKSSDPPPKKRVHFLATCSGDKSSDPPPKKRVHFEATGSGDKSSETDQLLQELKQSETTNLKRIHREQRYHVCGEVLEYDDFKSLIYPNWLNDKVMNAYLSVLRSQCNTSDNNHVFIIPSYLAVLWDAGRFNTWMMREINLVMFKWIFMPINITNNHWILLAANVPQMSVSILDSMDTGKGLSYVGKWKKFMHNRSRLVGEFDGEWKTGHLMSAQQKDGNSCGPFVLMNALALTRDILLESLTHEHVLLMRTYVFTILKKNAVKPPGQRKKCDMPGCLQPEMPAMWVACDVCGRWCHFLCVGMKKKPMQEYLCPICIAQYR